MSAPTTPDALLPCPFCGGNPSLARCGFGTARVTCMDCGAEGQYCQSHEDAITAWNTRAQPAPAVTAPSEAVGLKTPNSWIWDFLMGSGGYMGVFFGDRHPDHKGLYWWRNFLSEELEAMEANAALQTTKPQDGSKQGSGEPGGGGAGA